MMIVLSEGDLYHTDDRGNRFFWFSCERFMVAQHKVFDMPKLN